MVPEVPVVPVGSMSPEGSVVLGTLVLTSSQGLGNMTSRTFAMKLHTEMTVLVSEEVIGEDEDRREVWSKLQGGAGLTALCPDGEGLGSCTLFCSPT